MIKSERCKILIDMIHAVHEEICRLDHCSWMDVRLEEISQLAPHRLERYLVDILISLLKDPGRGN